MNDTIAYSEELTDFDDNSLNIPLEEIVQQKISKHVRYLQEFFSQSGTQGAQNTQSVQITEKKNASTNIIDVLARRTYNVSPGAMEQMFTLMDVCRREDRMLHYSERQETATVQKSGFMIDFDRYQLNPAAEVTSDHIMQLVNGIAALLNKLLVIEHVNRRFVFHMFVIRKPKVMPAQIGKGTEARDVFKDGWHILIPELQTIKGFKRYFLQELMDSGLLADVFSDIPHIEDANCMLDLASARNPVHFFGHSKPGKPAYPLTHAIEVTFFASAAMGMNCRSLDVAKILDGSYWTHPVNLTYELSLCVDLQTMAGHPTWLKKRHMNFLPAIEAKIQASVEKSTGAVFTDDELQADNENMSIVDMVNVRARYVHKLCMMLDGEYAADYGKWFKVMCAIAHCGTTADYKCVAQEFSKRRPGSYSGAEFERVWAEAVGGRAKDVPVTLGSLKYWAKQCAPAAYAEGEKDYYVNVLTRTVYENEGRVEHAQVSDILRIMCGDKFVCDSGNSAARSRFDYCWYEFIVPGQKCAPGEIYKWRAELNPDNLHLYIAKHLPKVYSQVKECLRTRREESENEAESKYWSKIEKTFGLYQSKLSNDSFQNGVVSQAKYHFRQRGFCKEMDSYPDIIGVGNGVLKLGITPQLIKGYHEYKVSKYTEVEYVPYDPNNPRIKTLERAFRDIFIEEDTCEFMLYHASTGLDGEESRCIATMIVGGGSNGKTFFGKIVHNTLGNMYCAAGKAALLTAPMERGESANSAQMQQKDKRWFYIDEFNACETLNTMRLKAIVTPGWQSGRDLHEKQSNFKNTSNLVCFSNFDFIINTTDHGTWRRIYYISAKTKFCEKPDPNNPYEKRADKKFADEYVNDPLYRQAMLSIMVHYNSKLRRLYKGDLSNVPVPSILRETEEYRNRQDTVNRFITQMVVESPRADKLSVQTIAGRYIEWYNRNVKVCVLSIFDVISQFENSRIAGRLVRENSSVLCLPGHRIKTYPEEPLAEGESYVVKFDCRSVDAVNTVNADSTISVGNTDVPYCTLRDKSSYIEEYSEHAYIQRGLTKAKVDDREGAVDELLKNI